jgi:DNA-binding XRE family transcriptional regulator
MREAMRASVAFAASWARLAAHSPLGSFLYILSVPYRHHADGAYMAQDSLDSRVDEHYIVSMISAAQCRAARGMLRWSVAELARRARVSNRTIIRHEAEESDVSPPSLSRMMRAFEDAGVQFRRDGSVRLVERKGDQPETPS